MKKRGKKRIIMYALGVIVCVAAGFYFGKTAENHKTWSFIKHLAEDAEPDGIMVFGKGKQDQIFYVEAQHD